MEVEIVNALRADAAKVLTEGRAKVVIGYQARGEQRAPAFITDPAKVKLYALKAAAEVAEAVLRINVIIRKRDDGTGQAQRTDARLPE